MERVVNVTQLMGSEFFESQQYDFEMNAGSNGANEDGLTPV